MSISFKHIILTIGCLILSTVLSSAQVRILTIGDSTMADYDVEKNSGENEMRGWGQILPIFLKDNVQLNNAAKNGRSSKSFYYEFWESLRETLKPGDYVFIQFGHNDEKANGQDTDETDKTQRGTAAWGQYQKYLKKYINETREKGAIPILFTPVVRRSFNKDNSISDKGLHNLSEFAGNDSLMNYPLAMRTVAKELSVPLVDMTLLTAKLVESYGPEKSKEVIYCNKDNTHLKEMGAALFAQLAVNDLTRQNILNNYLEIPDNIDQKLAQFRSNKKKEKNIPKEGGNRINITWDLTQKAEGFYNFSVDKKGLRFAKKKDKTVLTTESGEWPEGDIDLNSSRYFEFKLEIPSGKFYIDSLVLTLEAIGGEGMRFTALGSTKPDFLKTESFVVMESLPKEEQKEYKFNNIIEIPKGESFYLRIYPWYKNKTSNKYISLDNISLSGLYFRE